MTHKLEDKNRKHGVVQNLVVEADTFIALTAAVQIALTEHWSVNGATHFTDKLDEKGFSVLTIYNGSPAPADARELAFPIKSADAMADFIRMWLIHKAEYPRRHIPDTDGSVEQGFRAEIASYSEVISVKAHYIVYGK